MQCNVYVSGKAALKTRIADLESAHHPPTGAKLANLDEEK
jgi:hypothetical protein